MIIDTFKRNRLRASRAVLNPVHAPLYPIGYNGKQAVDRTHVAGYYYPDVEPPIEYAVYYAIEIAPVLYDYNEKSLPTLEIVGLKNGVFRWITGAPGFYNNSHIELRDEKGHKICNSWYEGVLIKGGLSNPSRKIDIKDGGDYATLNGFNFAVRNDTFFWSLLEQYKIYVTNSSVKVFAVLDKTFYSLWQGVVKSTSYTETDFEFKCESNFRTVHGDFPHIVMPNMIFVNKDLEVKDCTENQDSLEVDESTIDPVYLDVDEDVKDQIIPICLGDVEYAKGLKISNYEEDVTLVEKNEDEQYTICAAFKYEYRNSEWLLHLITAGKYFVENDHSFKDKYLCVIKGGSGNDYYRIVGNHTTDNNITAIILADSLQGWDDVKNKYSQDSDNIENNVWFFRVIDAYVIYIFSRRKIKKFFRDVYNYEDKYRLLGNFIGANRFEDGKLEIKTHSPISMLTTVPERLVNTETEDVGRIGCDEFSQDVVPRNLYDNMRDLMGETITSGFRVITTFTLGKLDFNDFEQYHLCFEMDCAGINKNEWAFQFIALAKDMYNDSFTIPIFSSDKFIIKSWKPSMLQEVKMNTISNDYYKGGYIDNNDLESMWPGSFVDGRVFDFKSMTTLDQVKIKELLRLDDYQDIIRLKVIVRSTTGRPISQRSIWIKEISFRTENNNEDQWWQIHNIWRVLVSGQRGNTCSDYCDHKRSKRSFDSNSEFVAEGSNNSRYVATYDVAVPDELLSKDSSNLCIDIDIEGIGVEWSLECEAYRVKANGEVEDGPQNNLFVNKFEVPIQLNTGYNFFPADCGVATEYSSLWPIVSGMNDRRFRREYNIRGMTQIKPPIINLMKQGMVKGEQIQLIIFGERNLNDRNIKICFSKIGIVGVNKLKFSENEVYTSCEGEYFVDGVGESASITESNSVYGALYNIIRGYDGLAVGEELSEVDFGNLLETRVNVIGSDYSAKQWHVGRQITESKSSFDYVKELCQQSFIGAFPSRRGALTFRAWREKNNRFGGRASPFFNEEIIIRDSIKNFKRTEPQDLFNEFKIYYDYEPGGGTYRKSIFVTRSNELVFPGYDDKDKLWTSFVGGLPYSDAVNRTEESDEIYEVKRKSMYNTAKLMWEQCREGYKFTNRRRLLDSDSLTKLEWCVGDDYALNYLGELVSWLTRPKAQVEFSIPLNGYLRYINESYDEDEQHVIKSLYRNIELDLLDRVQFSDTVYTMGSVLTGYVIKIEPDLKKNEIKLGLIFEPDNYADIIIERGIPLNDLMPLIKETGEGRGSGRVEGLIIEGGVL